MIMEARRCWAAAAPRKTDVVLDLGAHVGGFTTWAARECGALKVVGYEAAPDTYATLQVNVADLSNVEIHNKAIVNSDESHVK